MMSEDIKGRVFLESLDFFEHRDRKQAVPHSLTIQKDRNSLVPHTAPVKRFAPHAGIQRDLLIIRSVHTFQAHDYHCPQHQIRSRKSAQDDHGDSGGQTARSAARRRPNVTVLDPLDQRGRIELAEACGTSTGESAH
jgi:hypothetical protein